MERAIFVTRAQPFHKGHYSVVKQMHQAKDVEEIIIGIGSSQLEHTLNNPFTFEEREEMLRKSLILKKPFYIIPIPDINNHPIWVAYVEKLTPEFKIVYTGNPLVKKLFEEKDYQVRDINHDYQISATKVRELMITGGNWQNYLSQGGIDVITRIRGAERLKNIYCAHLRPGVTVDALINYKNEGIVLIQRKTKENDAFGGWWALPGGFLNTGEESLTDAVAREVGEETSLQTKSSDYKLFDQYSDPQRDPRGHIISLVFETLVDEGNLIAADDAEDIKVFPFNQLPTRLAFDHNKILNDYLEKRSSYETRN